MKSRWTHGDSRSVLGGWWAWIALSVLVCVEIVLTTGGCAVNPATGERQIALIGEDSEVAMGRQASEQVAASMGLYEDDALQAYVSSVGQRLAAESERPDLPWQFAIVDDPAVNAFALPGGYIYLTRGIMSYFNSEAEMAAVLGHEIGHVTGRHSVEQISRQQLAGLGLGLGMMVVPELQQFGGVAQTGLSLLFLKYGRDDERQADDLGLRYMAREGYDPAEMPRVFDTLARVSSASGESPLPSWLSTHPAPQERAERIRAVVGQARVEATGRQIERDRYLSEIDGLVFGEDPRQGYFRDRVFFHPDLAFRVAFPNGWRTANQPAQVVAVSPNRDAVVVLSTARGNSAEVAAQSFFTQRGLRAERPGSGRVNGLPAVGGRFAATSEDGGQIAGMAAFIEHGKNVYAIVGYTGANRWGSFEGAFNETINSFDVVADRRILAVEPRRLDIVRLDRSMTVRELAGHQSDTASAQTLALINQVDVGERIPSGTRVKRVVGNLPG